jgi:ubiquinol-cytochrome c reductase cytochrome c subunit
MAGMLRLSPSRVCVGLAALALAACAAPPPPDAGAGAGTSAGAVQQGRQVFMTQCHGCHTLGAAGTPIAPDLSHIGSRLTPEELERRLRDPRTHRATAHMPRLALSEPEIRALVAFLSDLR